MNWLSSVFGTKKSVDDILDKDNGLLVRAGGWVDGLQYTDQEQAEFRMKVADSAVQYINGTLGESTERSMTRRRLSVMWITFELMLVLTSAVCGLAGLPGRAEFIWLIATSDLMMWGTLSVLSFFLGPYMIGAHIKSKS